MELLWDGSPLQIDISQMQYWRIGGEYCRVKKKKDIIPIILDEMKPLFHLPKTGTHSLDKFILFRVASKGHFIFADMDIDSVSEEVIKQCKPTIQEILIFREIFGIPTRQSHIKIRFPYKTKPWPVSLELSFVQKLDNWCLTETIIKKWFDNRTPYKTLNEMLKRSGYLRDGQPQLRYDTEKVIKRIDKDYIWICQTVINRLNDLIDRFR